MAGRRRRLLRRLGVALLAIGVLGLVEVVVTMAWQEPFSALKAAAKQDAAAREAEELADALVPPREAAKLRGLSEGERLRALARRLRRTAEDGRGIGRVEIPSLGVDVAIVEGTDGKDLERGPGHEPGTDLPGEPGTVGIAGHRTTYGAPFRHIDDLRRGDRVVVRMPYGRFEYRVTSNVVVTPDRVEVLEDDGRPQVVLIACTPLFSSAKRIVVTARQVDAVPR